MLNPVIDIIGGIPTIRPGSEFFTRTLSIRPRARQLRDRYNSVYSAQFDAAHPARAHQKAEDAVVTVAEAVLVARLTAYVEAHAPKPAPAKKAPARTRRTRDPQGAERLAQVVAATLG